MSTPSKLNDISVKVLNFLKFVDRLPIRDKYVDEIRTLITELKYIEKEKVKYMTYQIKIAEEREYAKPE